MLAAFTMPGPTQIIIVSLTLLLLVHYRLPTIIRQFQEQLLQPLRPRRKKPVEPPLPEIRFRDLIQIYAAVVLLLAMHFALSPVLALSFSVVLGAIVLSKV